MAAESVLSILSRPPPTPEIVEDPNPVTSRKEWANGFTMYSWKVQSIDPAEFRNHFERWNEEDAERSRNQAIALRHTSRITNEAEVWDYYSDHIAWYLKMAFTEFPYVNWPSEHGPGFLDSPNQMATDSTPRYKGEYLVVKEMKKAGMIKWAHWRDPSQANSGTLLLAGQLVAYVPVDFLSMLH